MQLKLKRSNAIPMNTLRSGEFGVLVEPCGSEPTGTVVWGLNSGDFAVVGSLTQNKFYANATGLVTKLSIGDILEIAK